MNYNTVKCQDCIYFDLREEFYSSNLRKCSFDGKMHWKGEEADSCLNFVFHELHELRTCKWPTLADILHAAGDVQKVRHYRKKSI